MKKVLYPVLLGVLLIMPLAGAVQTQDALIAEGNSTFSVGSEQPTTEGNIYSASESTLASAVTTESISLETKPVSICYIPDSLMKEYDDMIYELREAEARGDSELAGNIRQRLSELKEKIAKAQEECETASSGETYTQIAATKEAPMVVAVDRCAEASAWETKMLHYEKLQGLSDSELHEQAGLTREELGKILTDLRAGLYKLREQCEIQRTEATGSASAAMPAPQTAVAEPVKPVAPDSGQEIDRYYRARIEKISSLEGLDSQIDELKTLRDEIDQLIADMIRYRDEIEGAEISGLAEVRINPYEIRANDVVVNTSGRQKRIYTRIGEINVTVEPREGSVFVLEEGMQVRADEVSVKDNKLRVGDSEIAVPVSEVVRIHGIVRTPKLVELGEEEGKAVYNIHVEEDRNLLGIIPVKMERSVTTDATDPGSRVIRDERPWWSFLTTVAASSYGMGTLGKMEE
jgi:uncharacterized protein YdcH (DUF465 family)